jgi:hypothetical protein
MQGMQGLAQFLDKFKSLGAERFVVRELVSGALKQVLNVDIPKEQIQFKEGVVTVTAHPAIKNAIIVKKERILDVVRKGTKKVVKDIR